MTPVMNTSHLATLTEIAREQGRSIRTVRYWAKKPGFPRPIWKGPVHLYDREQVELWLKDPTGRRMAVIREYRRTNNVSAAARHAGVARSTATQWIKAHPGERLPSELKQDVTANG